MPLARATGKLAVATLKELGYVTKLHVVEPTTDRYFETIGDSRNRVQAGFFAWEQDYPAPSDFLTPLFTCRAIAQRADDDLLQYLQDLRPAYRQRRRPRAFLADHQSTSGVERRVGRRRSSSHGRLAPWVPLANTRNVVVVSRRVRNVQSNQQWGVLIDQISVR